MTKPTYEDAIAFIEAQDIRLLDYQKDLLKIILEKEICYFVPSRFYGRRLYLENVKLLTQLLTKEKEDEE